MSLMAQPSDTGRFGDKRHGPRRSRVDLDHINAVVLNGVLNIHQPLDLERVSQKPGVMMDGFEMLSRDLLCRQNAGRVARVDSRFLNMLLNTRDHNCCFIGQSIDIKLGRAFEKFVDQDRLLR